MSLEESPPAARTVEALRTLLAEQSQLAKVAGQVDTLTASHVDLRERVDDHLEESRRDRERAAREAEEVRATLKAVQDELASIARAKAALVAVEQTKLQQRQAEAAEAKAHAEKAESAWKARIAPLSALLAAVLLALGVALEKLLARASAP